METEGLVAFADRKTAMQRIVLSFVTATLIFGIAGYGAGIFTGETRKEESCALCRATRFTGVRYGMGYERIESSVLTNWYRARIDPDHGQDSAHPHMWLQSACTVNVAPGATSLDYDCVETAPLLLLRPEIERAVLSRITDRDTALRFIQSLNTLDKRLAMQRVKTLIEYYYVEKDTMPFIDWWHAHSAEFGL